MTYTPSTIRGLQWSYGLERAADIVSGLDEATNADIQAWRNIGGIPLEGRPPRDVRLEKARALVRDGASFEDAALIADVNVVALKSSWYQRHGEG